MQILLQALTATVYLTLSYAYTTPPPSPPFTSLSLRPPLPPHSPPLVLNCVCENQFPIKLQFQPQSITPRAILEDSKQFHSTTVPYPSTIGISADFCSTTVNAYSSRK